MTKNYEDWDLYDIEKHVNKDSFIPFLNYVYVNDGMTKVIATLKSSGYFISYNDMAVIKDKQREKIEDYINSHFSENGIKKCELLKREALFLEEKREEINSKILNIFENNNISSDVLVGYVNWKLDCVCTCVDLSETQKLSTQEYYIFILGILLKTKLYTKSTEITDKSNVSYNELNTLFNFTFMYRELNEVIQSWMYGDVKIEKDDFLEIEELPGNNEDRIVSASNYWDIKDVKNIKSHLIEFEKTGKWQDNLNVYENQLREKIKEDFYTQDFLESYLGIQLYKWVEVFKLFADKAYKTDVPILKLQREQLIKEIAAKGLTMDEAEQVVICLIFNKHSKDLFDSFLIEQDGEFLFCPKMFLFIDSSKAMMSLFGKAKESTSRIGQKGQGFEHHIYLLISKNVKGVQCNINVNFKDEEYEVDLVFILNNDLFICECKTQYQHEDMRGYYRNLKELEGYLKKFERNYKFFVEHEEGKRMLREALNIQAYNNIYPVFISNIAFIESKINNIYITDEARIYRYMKRVPAYIGITEPNKKLQTFIRLFPQFYEGEITSAQFIEYLNNKQNEIELERKKIILAENPTLKEFGIVSKRYTEDKQALKRFLFAKE